MPKATQTAKATPSTSSLEPDARRKRSAAPKKGGDAATPEARTVRRPHVTLVLGAGVSKGLVPDWDALTDALQRRVPEVGFAPTKSCDQFPNENQLRLELVWRAILDQQRKKAAAKTRGPIGRRMLALERDAERKWIDLLRAELYPSKRHDALEPYLSLRRSTEPPRRKVDCPATTLSAIVGLLTARGI